MTVKELIKELGKLKQDSKVVMSMDSEGNGYCDNLSVNTMGGYKGYIIYPAGKERCELDEVLPTYDHNSD